MTTKHITMMALFSAISIIATRFLSFMIPLGGFPTLSVGIGGIPIMVSGILFGPLSGAIVGGVSDLVGFLINDRGGVYHYGFTLNSILTGFIPGVLVLLIRQYHIKDKLIGLLNYGLLFGATGVGIYYLWTNQSLALQASMVWILTIVLLLVGIALSIIMLRLRQNEQAKRLLHILIFCVLIVEILVYVGLTPIWIYGLYGIPSVVSIISRVLRMVLLVPIKVILLLGIIKVSAKGKELF